MQPDDDIIFGAGPAAIPARKPLTGPMYREFVRVVASVKRARSYLEVGVYNASTLSIIECASIGVDPEFAFDRNPMGKKPSLRLYQMTSDDYFRDHDPRTDFGGPVDVAFLDGMHLFEYLLRDFINTERACAPGSVILLDDCLPINIEMAERERRPHLRKDRAVAAWWTGDVWKVLHILREYRPELKIVPVDVVPTGSIAVTNLDPDSTRLQDAYDEIVARYMDMELTPALFDQHWIDFAPLPVPAAVPALFPNVVVKRAGAS